MTQTRRHQWLLPFVTVLMSGCSCLNPYCRGATGLLPPVTLSEAESGHPLVAAGQLTQIAQVTQTIGRMEDQPANPYRPAFGNALARDIYSSSSGTGFRVDIRDFLVGPGRKASGIRLAGPAVVEIRSG